MKTTQQLVSRLREEPYKTVVSNMVCSSSLHASSVLALSPSFWPQTLGKAPSSFLADLLEEHWPKGPIPEEELFDIKNAAMTVYAGMGVHSSKILILTICNVSCSWNGYGEIFRHLE